jgi:hypothetical protein
VVAEDAVDRPLECLGDRRELRKRLIEGTKRLSPEVAGDDGEIIFKRLNEGGDGGHRRLAHVDVEVAEVEDREAAKGLR